MQLEHPPLESLSAYLDHDLSDREQADVSRHVQGCDHCRTELDALQQTLAAFRALPELEAPAGFSARVMSQIEAREQQGFWAFVRRWRLSAVLTPIAVAMLVVVMVRRPEADRIEMPAVEQAKEAYREDAARNERLGQAPAPDEAAEGPRANLGADSEGVASGGAAIGPAGGSAAGSAADTTGSSAVDTQGDSPVAGLAKPRPQASVSGAPALEPPPAEVASAVSREKLEASADDRDERAPAHVPAPVAAPVVAPAPAAPPAYDAPAAARAEPRDKVASSKSANEVAQPTTRSGGSSTPARRTGAKDNAPAPEAIGSLGYAQGSGGYGAGIGGSGQSGSLGLRGTGAAGAAGAAPGSASPAKPADMKESSSSSPKQEVARRSVAKEPGAPMAKTPASPRVVPEPQADDTVVQGAGLGAAEGRNATGKNGFAPAPPMANAPASGTAARAAGAPARATSSPSREDEASAGKADRAAKASVVTEESAAPAARAKTGPLEAPEGIEAVYATEGKSKKGPARELKKQQAASDGAAAGAMSETASTLDSSTPSDARASAREARARQVLLAEPPDAIVTLDDGPGRQQQVKQATLRLHGWALAPEPLSGGRTRIRVFLPAGSYAKFLKDLEHRGALGATPPIPAKNVEKIWVEFNLEP